MILPIALDVRNRTVLIFGGGPVAARKAASFLEAGALVTVISPELAPDFPPVTHLKKRYKNGDLGDFSLVCACTNNPEVNAQIALDARDKNIWCNIADAPEGSDFHTSAVVRRDEIAIGISTSGLSPVLSRHLKTQIESCIGPEYQKLLEMARAYPMPTAQRGAFWRAILETEILELLRSNEHKMAAETLESVFKSLSPQK